MKVIQVNKYGVDVWCNEDTDNLRKEQCLCLNCGISGACSVSSEFYEICKRDNVALMVTRCPAWEV